MAVIELIYLHIPTTEGVWCMEKKDFKLFCVFYFFLNPLTFARIHSWGFMGGKEINARLEEYDEIMTTHTV